MIHRQTLVSISAACILCVFGCSKLDATSSSSATSATVRAAAEAPPAATATAKPEVKTTDLTPGAIKQSFSALMGKQVAGEGVMYHFESVTLNGEKQHNAYVADDENKTNSIQCMLKEPTQIKAKTKVTFKGTLRTANWIVSCEIAEKK